ncbi:helix-turn-helix domain-containing protein [Ihubacter sp. rT4E-8]|uniref:helix-turn-helix domain-containing protein n=1 Tax=Ihubacter sp. rT4E-8 TaxID=3242369 RepID=UPI003CE9F172
MMEQKIKQDSYIPIGENIRRIRKSKGIGQTELVRRLQLQGIEMTRETLVKIERGIQHLQAQQLQGIRDILETSYDDLLAPKNEEE